MVKVLKTCVNSVSLYEGDMQSTFTTWMRTWVLCDMGSYRTGDKIFCTRHIVQSLQMKMISQDFKAWQQTMFKIKKIYILQSINVIEIFNRGAEENMPSLANMARDNAGHFSYLLKTHLCKRVVLLCRIVKEITFWPDPWTHWHTYKCQIAQYFLPSFLKAHVWGEFSTFWLDSLCVCNNLEPERKRSYHRKTHTHTWMASIWLCRIIEYT